MVSFFSKSDYCILQYLYSLTTYGSYLDIKRSVAVAPLRMHTLLLDAGQLDHCR